ncbi:SCO3374 family protein [Streptomyces sp. NPDC006012]|uniref:SCO3374 family protein n=1 Tax=Streptomyces sp. NPDC006012 TaxID=3364739 RepID=UPI0036AB9E59
MAGTVPMVPSPRRPAEPDSRARHWYENALGWATVPGEPLRLRTGVRFDVLDVPAEAGGAALRHLAPGSPVAVGGGRMRFLVAAGSAEELPGLLEWLEWGSLPLDLLALGADGSLEAPALPGPGASGPRPLPADRGRPALPAHTLPALAVSAVPAPRAARSVRASCPVPRACPVHVHGPVPCATAPCPVQGAAVWLRPPEPGCEAETSLPTLSAVGGGGGAPDLVRLVDTVAAHCHRIRLRRGCAGPAAVQPLAFS